jgi:hypothetical protein
MAKLELVVELVGKIANGGGITNGCRYAEGTFNIDRIAPRFEEMLSGLS